MSTGEIRTALDDEFASVSASRQEEVRRLCHATFDTRTQWIIGTPQPTADAILDRYPKFQSTPEMVSEITVLMYLCLEDRHFSFNFYVKSL